MKLREIVKELDAEVVVDADNMDAEIEMACGSDMMSDVLAFAKDQAVFLTGLMNAQVVRTAEMMDMRCIIFVRGKKVDEMVANLVRKQGSFDYCDEMHDVYGLWKIVQSGNQRSV